MFREISIAAGSRKLIAGQVADLEAEGKKVTRAQLRYIHENKTAAIFTTSVRLGAMSANASAKQLAPSRNSAARSVWLFRSSTTFSMSRRRARSWGRARAKMSPRTKATYPAVIGLEKSRAEAQRLTNEAHNALNSLGKKQSGCESSRIICSSAITDCLNWERTVAHASARAGEIILLTSRGLTDCVADTQTSGSERAPAEKIMQARDSDRFPRSTSKRIRCSNRSIAANAIMAALSVQSQGSALTNFNPAFLAGCAQLLPQFTIATDATAQRRQSRFGFAARRANFSAQEHR